MKPIHTALFWMQLFTLSMLFELGGYVTSGSLSTAYHVSSGATLGVAGLVLLKIVYDQYTKRGIPA